MSAVNTLTIRPASGMSVTISGSVNAGALVRIFSNQVTINGSNNGSNSRNLTLINTSTSEPRVILFGSIGTIPIVNSSIRNCIISNGNTDKSCVAVSDGNSIASPGYFNNITIENNAFRKSMYGIYCSGVPQTSNGSGLIIRANDLSATSTNAIQMVGIYLEGVDGALIKDNLIGNFRATDSAVDKGIHLSSNVRNTIIQNNKITNLVYTGSFNLGSFGMYVTTGQPNANITIVGNMIAGIGGRGGDVASFNNPTGIFLAGTLPQGNIRVCHNSIHLFGNTLNASGAMSSCIRIRTGSTADIRNNMLVNRLGLQSTTGLGAAAIITSQASGLFDQLNYNNYSVTPSGSGIKAIGYVTSNSGAYTTISSWRIITGGETNGLSIAPVFVSNTDLHLRTNANASLNNRGIYIPGFAFDLDNASRNPVSPDMGCFEFVPAGTANWIGTQSTDVNEMFNWEANQIPNASTNVRVSNESQQPIVVNGQLQLNDLLMTGTGMAIRLGNGSVMKIAGTITRNSGSIDAENGQLFFSGTAPQRIPAQLCVNNRVQSLLIGNTSAVGVELDGPLTVSDSLAFTAASTRFNTNGHLTLSSELGKTASIGNLTGKTLVGDVTVERFIPVGINHPKSWQFISMPVFGDQTIHQAWQDTAVSANQNRYPGYGTQITGNVSNNSNATLAAGFDVYTPSGSTVRVYQSVTNTWQSVSNTLQTPVYQSKGYFVFVRGDRSVTTANAPAMPTKLRAKGKLFTANNGETPPSISVSGNQFESVGNPYASAIEFRNLSLSGTVDSAFYVWDPLLSGARGLGGYQLVSATNGYLPIPGGTANYSGLEPVTTIQSGQAFFVHATGSAAGTVGFTEAAKVSGSSMVYRQSLRSNHSGLVAYLYSMTGTSRRLADGCQLQFSENGNNEIDGRDALKIKNPGENLSFKHNSSEYMLIERRIGLPLDTFHFSLSGLLRQSYELQLIGHHFSFPGCELVLADRYLQTALLIQESDTLVVPFTVTSDPLSCATDRFYLYLRPTSTLPVRFVRFDASLRQESVQLDWSVAQEHGIESYQVERSVDGRIFEFVGQVSATHQTATCKNYQFFDRVRSAGPLYYRVSAMERGRTVSVSRIIRLLGESISSPVTIVPVGGADGSRYNLYFSHMRPGSYQLQVFNMGGQCLLTSSIPIHATQAMVPVSVPVTRQPLVVRLFHVETRFTFEALVL